MKRVAIAVVGVALLAVACGSAEIVATSTQLPATTAVPDAAPQLDALAAARHLWAAAPSDYTVSVGAATLAVRGDEVVSLASGEARTVEDVFGTIEQSIRDGAVVEVAYDDEFGFPTRVVIDLDGDGTPDVDLTFADLEAMPVVETLEQLLEARALWEAQDLDAYRFIFRADCTCADGGTWDIEVHDGRVTQFVALDDEAESSQLTPTPMDVAFDDLEAWFTDSSELIDEGILALDVRMDPDLGYPRWFHVEGATLDDGTFNGPFTIVVTMDLVLPFVPIDDEPDGAGASTEDERALSLAQALWAKAGLTDYSYQLALHCECPLSVSGPFEVTVRGGELNSVVHLGDAAGAQPDVVMIDEFFEVIALAVGAEIDVDVTYDESVGYPTLAIIDVEAVAVDGGLAFSVSDFETVGDTDTRGELGRIVGTALAGPQCPVQQNPPQPGCEDQPVVDVPIFVGPAHGGGLVPMTNTDKDGRFSISLAPGDYLVTGQARDEYMGNPGTIEVTVKAGAVTEIDLHYDTGIR